MSKKVVIPTRVTIVRKNGGSALVEYLEDGEPVRKYVPVDEIDDKHVSSDVLQQGIPYGYPWEELQISFDSQKFSHEMKQVGLWTVEDVLRNPQKLWSVLRATLADNIKDILTISSQEKKRSRRNG